MVGAVGAVVGRTRRWLKQQGTDSGAAKCDNSAYDVSDQADAGQKTGAAQTYYNECSCCFAATAASSCCCALTKALWQPASTKLLEQQTCN